MVNKIIEKDPNLVFSYLILGYLHWHRDNYLTGKDVLVRFIDEFRGEEKWRNVAKELLTKFEEKMIKNLNPYTS